MDATRSSSELDTDEVKRSTAARILAEIDVLIELVQHRPDFAPLLEQLKIAREEALFRASEPT